MIALRIVGGSPYVDQRFLDSSDVPFIILAIILLFITYYKIKNRKPEKSPEKIHNEVNNPFELKIYDVLMQPTKNNGSLPFINFSLPIKEILIGIGLLIFYYLIFTEKI